MSSASNAQLHTPSPSISQSVGAVAVLPSTTTAPAPTTAAVAPVPTTLGDPTPVLVPISCDTHLKAKDRGHIYNIRGHPRVKDLLKLFVRVEVVRVEAFVYQGVIFGPPATGKHEPTLHCRFGIVPADLALTYSSGGNDYRATEFIPALQSLVAGTINPTSSTCVWGRGGAPFPPGVQADLRAIQVRSNYLSFLICHTNDSGSGDDKVFVAQLNMQIECQGIGFANIY